MAYGNKQKPYEAIKVYEKASSLASNDGVEGIVQLNLTFQYAMLKRWSQANEHMKKTIALKVTVPEDIVATIKQNL